MSLWIKWVCLKACTELSCFSPRFCYVLFVYIVLLPGGICFLCALLYSYRSLYILFINWIFHGDRSIHTFREEGRELHLFALKRQSGPNFSQISRNFQKHYPLIREGLDLPIIFHIYHGENTLIFQDRARLVFYYTNTTSWILIVLAEWNLCMLTVRLLGQYIESAPKCFWVCILFLFPSTLWLMEFKMHYKV